MSPCSAHSNKVVDTKRTPKISTSAKFHRVVYRRISTLSFHQLGEWHTTILCMPNKKRKTRRTPSKKKKKKLKHIETECANNERIYKNKLFVKIRTRLSGNDNWFEFRIRVSGDRIKCVHEAYIYKMRQRMSTCSMRSHNEKRQSKKKTYMYIVSHE